MRAHLTHVLAAVRDLTRLELVTEAVRAVLEEAARTADHLLTGLVDEDWGRRYGRPVRLGKNPTRPKTRILAAGDDACRLLEHLHRQGSGYRPGPQAEALRQIVVQNYYRDAAGCLRWRTADDGGLPPSSSAIVSPYEQGLDLPVPHGHVGVRVGPAISEVVRVPRSTGREAKAGAGGRPSLTGLHGGRLPTQSAVLRQEPGGFVGVFRLRSAGFEILQVRFEAGIAGDGVLGPPQAQERGHWSEVERLPDRAAPMGLEVGQQMRGVFLDGQAQSLGGAFGHRRHPARVPAAGSVEVHGLRSHDDQSSCVCEAGPQAASWPPFGCWTATC